MKINIRFLAILLVVLAVCGAGTHFLHGYQVKRNAGVFLARADREEQEAEAADGAGKLAHQRKAVQFFLRYLGYRPRDTEARARLGMLMQTLARNPKDLTDTLLVYETVLRQEPARTEIRLRAVKLSLALGRPADALDHLAVLGAADSKDGELHRLSAQCLEAAGRYKEARAEYLRAVELPPVEIDTYLGYALLLRSRFNDPAAANKVMEQMAQAVPTARASLALCAYWRQLDRSSSGKERAARALAEARKRAPDDADVLLQAADMARTEIKTRPAAREEALALLRRGIKLYPRDSRMYQALAELQEATGQRSEALATLRQGLEQLPGQSLLLWTLTDSLIAERRLDEAEELLEPMQRSVVAEPRIDYLRARLLLARDQWRDAADLFERLRPELESWPRLQRSADFLLAACYQKLGDLDQQHATYRRIVDADPLSVPGNLGLGATLEALGRDDDALRTYQRLAQTGQSPEARLRVARLLIRRNQQRPTGEQQWEEVQDILDSGARGSGDVIETAILQAEAERLRGEPDQAERILVKAQKQHPRELRLWVVRAGLAAQKQPKQAEALLDEAGRTLGDSVDLRLARASLMVYEDKGRRAAKLDRLAQNVERFSSGDQQRLLRGLALAHQLIEDNEGATRLWSQLARRTPRDLGVHIALFDLALRRQDSQAMTSAIQQIRSIEGEDGVFGTYARAAQLLRQASSEDRDALKEARGLLERVKARRPSWPRPLVALAALEEKAGSSALAINYYRQAIDLGDHSSSTIQSAVLLLYQHRRYADAEALLRKLPRAEALPADLQRLAAEVTLFTGKSPERGFSLAQQAVARTPNDYRAHLWLGQLLSRSDAHAADAEKSLRRALQLGKKEPETWVALVQHLVRAGKKDEAEKLVEQAGKELSGDKAALALARCQEIVGRLEQARKGYREALAAHPDDVGILTSAAQFYLRSGELADAEKCLSRLVDSKARPEDVAWARRTLAFVIYDRGDYQQKQRALAMLRILDEPPTASALQEMSTEDVHTRAAFLAVAWDRRQRQEAIRLLESLAARQPLTADERFLLGKTYESVGKWGEASRNMSGALSGENENIAYLAAYVDSLLRHKEWDTAAVWLAKVEARQPSSFLVVQRKARLLHGRGEGEEAAAVVQRYAQSKDANLQAAAVLLETVDHSREAEELFRKRAAAEKGPEATLDLARFLGRQGRTSEALDVSEQVEKTSSPAALAETCLRVLYGSPDPRSHLARGARLLSQAEARAAGKTDFTPFLAALRLLEGKYDESARLYRSLLERNSHDVLALNNLAFLLALQENKPQEALALVQQAWESNGPSPSLGDTRALIYLKLGENEKACAELEEVVIHRPLATAYFHLAQAREAAGERSAARLAFLKTRELKLKTTDLPPLERPAYAELSRRLGGK